MIKTQENIKSVITQEVSRPDSKFSNHWTYSTLFLTPMFDIQLDQLLYNYFVNAYIDDAELQHSFKRPLFILLQTPFLESTDFRIYDIKFRKNRNFVYSYSVGTENGAYLQMYVFECPQEFEQDYDFFIKGEYSKFSEYARKRFVKTIQTPDGQFEESFLYGIINKTYALKKKVETIIGKKLQPTQEYFGIPNREMEVFRAVKTPKDNYVYYL